MASSVFQVTRNQLLPQDVQDLKARVGVQHEAGECIQKAAISDASRVCVRIGMFDTVAVWSWEFGTRSAHHKEMMS